MTINSRSHGAAADAHGDAVSPARAGGAAPTLGPRHARPGRNRLSTARAGVLRALMAAREPITVTTLAEQLGQHPNTVREHLDALVEIDRVERFRSAPSGRGRPAWLYRTVMTTRPAAVGLSNMGVVDGSPLGSDGQEYLALALAIVDEVTASSANPQLLAREAGERWGRTLAEQRATREGQRTPGSASVAAPSPSGDPSPSSSPAPSGAPNAVIGLLRDLRFESQRGGDRKTMRLTTCPFLDAARHNPGVVCQVHLGIVRGALAQLGDDPDTAELREFAEPGACLLRFSDRR